MRGMDRHEWTEEKPGVRLPAPKQEFAVQGQRLRYREAGEEVWHVATANPASRTLAREVLRLAEERARLRPLLERCLEVARDDAEGRFTGPRREALITDLRRELGVEE